VPGQRRSGYRDETLEPAYDWAKYDAWYRVFGRASYDPDAMTPDEVARTFAGEREARRLVRLLGRASRILPLVTTAHLPSAACDAYWPEIYWNQPLTSEPVPNPYGDTPPPKTFLHVSPLDPQIFSSIVDCAGELLGDRPASGRYTPVEVATWLDGFVDEIDRGLRDLPAPATADGRRTVVDVRLLRGLGRFFAEKLRAGVLAAVHAAAGGRRALALAVERYRSARQAGAALSAIADPVYAADLSASDKISERGRWSDRLPAIDADIARLERQLAGLAPEGTAAPRLAAAVAAALARAPRPASPCTHVAAAGVRPGVDVPLQVTPRPGREVVAVRCHYRPVDQSRRFATIDLTADGGAFRGAIPRADVDDRFPLQYHFVVRERTGAVGLVPGLGEALTQVPYFVLRRQ
jgi:hypothetical protein